MSIARQRWEHQLQKIKRQAEHERKVKKLGFIRCPLCDYIADPEITEDCERCGAPLK
jgi:uncharacterized paraquat-inducible protein A